MDEPLVQSPSGATPTEQKETPEKIKVSRKFPAKKLLMVLASLVLLAAAAYGGYYLRGRKTSSENQTVIDALEKKVSNLEKAADATDPTDTEPATDTTVLPTADQLENIEASISSGNTAALEGRMATTVTVVIAASEGMGPRTITQAIGDLDYVVDLAATWDFNLSAATLDSYAAGDYAQYFPDGALVGKSSTGKVVSFIFDASAKIKTIFMSVNADIL